MSTTVLNRVTPLALRLERVLQRALFERHPRWRHRVRDTYLGSIAPWLVWLVLSMQVRTTLRWMAIDLIVITVLFVASELWFTKRWSQLAIPVFSATVFSVSAVWEVGLYGVAYGWTDALTWALMFDLPLVVLAWRWVHTARRRAALESL